MIEWRQRTHEATAVGQEDLAIDQQRLEHAYDLGGSLVGLVDHEHSTVLHCSYEWRVAPDDDTARE